MIYLIYTVIILEILIAIIGIIAILKFDKKINKLNEIIIENRYLILEFSRNIRNSVNRICTSIKDFGEKFRNMRNNFVLKLVKKIILTSGLKILFRKHKKQLIYAELLFLAYETIQNSLKA